jgi:hypothetical protein
MIAVYILFHMPLVYIMCISRVCKVARVLHVLAIVNLCTLESCKRDACEHSAENTIMDIELTSSELCLRFQPHADQVCSSVGDSVVAG